jgi:hypothetical protein
MIPPQVVQHLDEILDSLVKNVEGSVHAFYRGDHKQNTSQVKSDQFRKLARESLMSLLGGSMTPRPGSTLGAMGGGSGGNAGLLEADEVAAITRCIMGWLPMGAPNAASLQSRCVAAAKELSPSWGEREKARTALKRAAG